MSGIRELRAALRASERQERRDPTALLAWLEAARARCAMRAERVPLGELERWGSDPETGNVVASGAGAGFFRVEGVRVDAPDREVPHWEQPIFTQPRGGILGMLARVEGGGDGPRVAFLVQAKAEPGNVGLVQLAPTVMASEANLDREHGGRPPALTDVLLEAGPGRELVYEARQNEEGSRFWRKSNRNRLVRVAVDDPGLVGVDGTRFRWSTLSELKAAMLVDDVVNPYVRTVLAPL